MKMQNTEMEFVTFGTQDVIATSGPGTPLGYFAGSVKNGYGGSTFDESGKFFTLGEDDGKSCYIDKEGLQANNYYIINSAEYYIDKSWGDRNYVLDVTGSVDAPSGSGYQSLDNAGAILSWLMSIATEQH